MKYGLVSNIVQILAINTSFHCFYTKLFSFISKLMLICISMYDTVFSKFVKKIFLTLSEIFCTIIELQSSFSVWSDRENPLRRKSLTQKNDHVEV
jgi:hypothetical protein